MVRWGLRLAGLVLAASAAAGCAGASAAPGVAQEQGRKPQARPEAQSESRPQGPFGGDETTAYRDALMIGGHYGPGQIAVSRAALERDPAAVVPRLELISYYASPVRRHDEEALRAHTEHVLWLVEHRPDLPVYERDETWLKDTAPPEAHRKAEALWLRHVAARPDDLEVRKRAAQFLMFGPSGDTAERLLREGARRSPKDPQWHVLLANLHSHRGRRVAGADAASELRKALAEREEAAALEKDPQLRFSVMCRLPADAVRAGDLRKAKQHANALLAASNNAPPDMAGDGIQDAHVALGRVALREGDLAAAARHLRAAGDAPATPDMIYGWPNLALANEMLKRGQVQPVREFLNQIREYWESDHGALARWVALLDQGKLPDLSGYADD
jgi:predicted Zn-dependent protease